MTLTPLYYRLRERDEWTLSELNGRLIVGEQTTEAWPRFTKSVAAALGDYNWDDLVERFNERKPGAKEERRRADRETLRK